jgi:hypothetical protein
MFSWPQGIVVGNLVASVIWAAPALVHLHRKLDRNHKEIKGWHCDGCNCIGQER